MLLISLEIYGSNLGTTIDRTLSGLNWTIRVKMASTTTSLSHPFLSKNQKDEVVFSADIKVKGEKVCF